ncbi:MAG TPA: NAD-dependent epimerase/dehydratase family protein [Phycisphaerae bacterium]|nr:NAD-dependent epimerase/dehydratase family protein [Phycisphaerae bacterium]HRW53629.1 NAD-dependent epimerase/dehydratase family protein [Phycisphaerae bacterium]
MRKPVILITGANGEIGHGLIEHFSQQARHDIVTLDLKPLDSRLVTENLTSIQGDILDDNVMQRIVSEFEIHAIYHLAAMLSTRSEYAPDIAHNVNVNGTLNLIKLAHEQARWHGEPVRFLFPSSIAAYGLPDLATKADAGRVSENEWNIPTTMYGCNKLYCEQLGRYYSMHFRQLAADRAPSGVDFRAIRFPGLISAVTLPAGGTSDYASEMVHAAAQGKPYACFVSESSRIPFMAMPDAIKALLNLSEAEESALNQRTYNVGSFSVSAGEIRDHVKRAFPNAEITFEPDRPRNGIVDSWPADVDDSAAARDWGWKPDYDARRAFEEYLAPTIAEFYRDRE